MTLIMKVVIGVKITDIGGKIGLESKLNNIRKGCFNGGLLLSS